MGFTILMNPPYGRGGIQKRIFLESCKHGKVFSLQPTGTWRTHVGNVIKLLPLHTATKEFGIAMFVLGIHSNTGKDIEWDISKVPTFEDYYANSEELKVTNYVVLDRGKSVRNGVTLDQPLKTSAWKIGSDKGSKVGNGVTINQPEKLYVSSFRGRHYSKSPISNGLQTSQKGNKNLLWFETKAERTNYIKNISKLIALQNLFTTNIFPQPKDRLLPPLDKEYTKKELVEYFGFPWNIYEEFDDIEKEEPDSHYTSYERWRDYRKEKYGWDWEEE